MEFSEKEKKLIILVAIVAFMSIGLPIIAGKYANEFNNREVALKRELQTELDDLSKKLATVEDTRQVLQENRENYLKWIESGAVGAQDPVPWVNLIKDITTKRALNPLSYNFLEEVDHPSESYPLTQDSTVNISSWQMSLELPMLHDMDMFMLLGELKARTESLFFPIECNLSRVEKDFELINRININSECQISWVFVKDPDLLIKTGG